MEKPQTSDLLECSICNESFSSHAHGRSHVFTCPNCQYLYCVECQRRYAKDDCMNCHLKFRQKFLIEEMGQSFLDKILKPKLIDELLNEQKESLKQVQPLVDWEKQLREQKKQLRFGRPMTIGPRPKISTISQTNQVFPCPYKECRGFVENGRCETCKKLICPKCREPQEDQHTCRMETLMSLAIVLGDSKPCPRCCALIHRTEGCNHMFCTNCRTPFDWADGHVMKANSNGHYLSLQRFSQNIPTREVSPGDEPSCSENQEFSIYRDRVKKSDLDPSLLETNVVHCLWDDSNTIRLIKRKKYHETTIELTTAGDLQELQVKFLMNELSEVQWARNIYHIHINKTLSLLYSDVLNIYLAMVDFFQTQLIANPNLHQQTEILHQYQELVELCNNSFQSIQEEYGGPLHHIRDPTREHMNNPSFV